MLKYIVYTFLFLGIYRLVVNFILPMLKMAKTVKAGMRQMQQQQTEDMPQTNQHIHNQPSQRVKEGDYIDYEEVK